jgi:formylglycine-generating enzyme required for sulfatase activity
VVLSLAVLSQPGCDRSPPAAGEPTPIADLAPLTNMVLIKAGSFVRQKQVVTLTHDFWLSKFEVTQGDYAAVTRKNPSNFQATPTGPSKRSGIPKHSITAPPLPAAR